MSAVIAGIFEGALDQGGASCLEIGAAAAIGAIESAGLEAGQIDAVLAAYAWEEPSVMFAAQLADAVGIAASYAETVCFGGASPAMMVARAARAIDLGLCQAAVLIAASNRHSGIGRAAAISALRDVLSSEFEVPYGAFIPPVYALTATRYMYEWGVTCEQLAQIAVMQRRHAALTPGAARQTPITVRDVLDSPVISSPLHLLDCCLVTDFAGAVVMTTQALARRLGVPSVRVLGNGEAHGRISAAEVPQLTRRAGAASARAAFAQARLRPADIDVAQLYDSFTITVLATLEDLGFCPKGRGGELIEAGAFALGGDMPINTNGGMLSYRTGGISHVIEAVQQLRGAADARQVNGAATALVHGIGGPLSSHCTLVLGVN
jgi:acetyl-CoA acetyltransferase